MNQLQLTQILLILLSLPRNVVPLSTNKVVELAEHAPPPGIVSTQLGSAVAGLPPPSDPRGLATKVALFSLCPFSLTGMARLMSQPLPLPPDLPFPLRLPLPELLVLFRGPDDKPGPLSLAWEVVAEGEVKPSPLS